MFITNFRKVEKQVDGEWVSVEFDDLRKGDVFRIFEPDGTPVTWDGVAIMEAISDAEDGSLMIQTVST